MFRTDWYWSCRPADRQPPGANSRNVSYSIEFRVPVMRRQSCLNYDFAPRKFKFLTSFSVFVKFAQKSLYCPPARHSLDWGFWGSRERVSNVFCSLNSLFFGCLYFQAVSAYAKISLVQKVRACSAQLCRILGILLVISETFQALCTVNLSAEMKIE